MYRLRFVSICFTALVQSSPLLNCDLTDKVPEAPWPFPALSQIRPFSVSSGSVVSQIKSKVKIPRISKSHLFVSLQLELDLLDQAAEEEHKQFRSLSIKCPRLSDFLFTYICISLVLMSKYPAFLVKLFFLCLRMIHIFLSV